MRPPTAGKEEEAAGGGAGEGAAAQLKKGPWTAAEDAILVDYVKKHREGNWNSVQKNSGLQRCGKSCRLRWANHLRPHLRKGSFSPDEEMLILRLHAELGNKWARISAHLPGRTDNEIKNYWNTRIKRRQRAGLPLYPMEIQQQMARRGSKQGPAAPAMSNLVPAPATPELMEGKPYFSTAEAAAQTPLPLFNSSAALLSPNPFGSLHQNPSRVRNISFQSQLSSVSPPASSLFHNSPSPSQYGLGSFDLSPPPPLHSPSYSVKMELPSSQLFSVSGEGNSGLLDALLQDACGIEDLPKDDLLLAPLPLATYSSLAPLSGSKCFAMDPLSKLGGLDSSFGIQVKKEVAEKVNYDVATLLDMILEQTTAPVVAQAHSRLADWYNNSDGCGEFSNNPPWAVTDDDIGVEMQLLASTLLMMPEEHD